MTFFIRRIKILSTDNLELNLEEQGECVYDKERQSSISLSPCKTIDFTHSGDLERDLDFDFDEEGVLRHLEAVFLDLLKSKVLVTLNMTLTSNEKRKVFLYV